VALSAPDSLDEELRVTSAPYPIADFRLNPLSRQSLRMLPLFLGAVLLLWQLCLVYHQAEHSLSEPDEICQLCQAADHMQHGLAAADFPTIIPSAFVLLLAASLSLCPLALREPSARSPPISHPA
jgi:hypothetical protein